ncbi:MAG: carboxypeptidase-like regulatory domain-containing protein, partial [Mucilaginibacter sp.]|uniref:STN domain-containing protein n=1 Tax=Mucilaginibacter sp. TaxID=1882438 RepID=UPI0031AA5825
MKLIFILLTASILQVSAATYGQQINLNVKEVSLQQVFKQLRKQSGYNFLYDSDMLNNARSVSFSLKNASLDDALKACFEGQPLTYIIDQNTVIVRPRPAPATAPAQDVTVTGRVVDEKGLAVPGVSVKIKGTNTGAVTNLNGAYSVKLPTGKETLVFSFIGYATQEIAVGGRTQLNVTLTEMQSALNEVVVVGYGTQKRADVNGAISSVGVSKLKDQPVTNLQGALEG